MNATISVSRVLVNALESTAHVALGRLKPYARYRQAALPELVRDPNLFKSRPVNDLFNDRVFDHLSNSIAEACPPLGLIAEGLESALIARVFVVAKRVQRLAHYRSGPRDVAKTLRKVDLIRLVIVNLLLCTRH